MNIIRVEAEHIDSVAKLFDDYRVWYQKPSDLKQAKEFLWERVNSNESVIYACQIDSGELIGFTQLYPMFSSTRMSRMWVLNDLFVSSDYRGKGVSKMLIENAKELARTSDACGVLLETQKTNDIGNKLYPSAGFELEDDVNFYFWTTD